MKKLYLLLFAPLFLASIAYAAPSYIYQQSILPTADKTYYIGTTTPSDLRYNGVFNNIEIDGTCSGSGCGGGGGSTFPFAPQTYGNSTSTVIGFLQGLFSTASSTFSVSPFFTDRTSPNLAYFGTSGKLLDVATSTLTAGTGLTGSFTQIGSGGSVALSTPVSIPNGGTATTSAVTNGVCRYNGSFIECDSLLTYTGSIFTSSNPTFGTSMQSWSYGGTSGTSGYGFRTSTASGGDQARITANRTNLPAASDSSLDFFNDEGAGAILTEGLTLTTGGLVGVASTSPLGMLSVGGLLGGTNPLYVVASSTSLGATTTVFEIDQNGNVSINNGASETLAGGIFYASTTGNSIQLDPSGLSTNNDYISINNNRTYFGYYENAGDAIIQAGNGKGIQFSVNSNTFGSGPAAEITSNEQFLFGSSTISNTGNTVVAVVATSSTSRANLFNTFNSSGLNLFNISSTGAITASALTAGTGNGAVCATSAGLIEYSAGANCVAGGTVTSVTLSTPNSTLTLGGTNPVTTSGTISADLNLTNPNNWTGLQTFLNASTSQLSVFQKAYFGGTATATIDSAGNIVIPSGSSLTNTGVSNGCGTFSSGVLSSTGTACGSGSGTVSNGVPGQFGYYSSNGTTVAGSFYGYASSTNLATLLGVNAGPNFATTSATVASTTAVGYDALQNLFSAASFSNTALGAGAGQFLGSSGVDYVDNTIIGSGAMQGANGNSFGNGNIIIGSNAQNIAPLGGANIVIGQNDGLAVPTSNGLDIGNVLYGSNIRASNIFYSTTPQTTGRIAIATSSLLSTLTVQNNESIGANYGIAAPTNGLIVQGNVGIGTTSPFATLSVVGGAGLVSQAISTIFAVASSTVAGVLTTPFSISSTGWVVTSGVKPTATGGSTNVVSGNQTDGSVTFTGTLVTSITVTFPQPVPANTTLQCTESDNSLAATADISATTTNSVTFGLSTGLSAGSITWHCDASNNNNN